MPPLVECVPNFSEGRSQPVLDELRKAIAAVAGVRVLDVQADTDHHRSVFTFVAPPDSAARFSRRAALSPSLSVRARKLQLKAEEG